MPISSYIGPLVTYNWNPTTQLTELLADLAGVESGTGRGATVAFLGDSVTDGFETALSNYVATTSLPAQFTAALEADGVTANQADFMGQGNELAIDTDARVTLFGGADWSFPLGAGGEVVGMEQVGAGLTFSPGGDVATSSLTLNYYETGSASLSVTVNGVSVGTVNTGDTGLLGATTLTLPASEVVTNVAVTDTNGGSGSLEGITLTSASPSIQVVDAGVGGEESSAVGTGQSETTPYNTTIINAEAAEQPTVAFVEFGINDVLQGNLTAAQTTANLALMVEELQSVGTEVVIVIPNPISAASWTTEISTLRTDVYGLAVQLNVGVIDLSGTSDDNASLLESEGLLNSDGVHPTAAYDAQYATELAALLIAPITVGIGPHVVACYTRGTLILTQYGEVSVEDLVVGNVLINAFGLYRSIKWIGWRSYTARFVAANPNVQPIRFCAGSIGHDLPRRDLLVSPEHAMFLNGVLVPAHHLVNSSTIVREPRLDRIDYYHIELETHDVLLAEGAPSESFVDDDSRGMFHNAHAFFLLYPDVPSPANYCARRVEQGAELEAIRHQLAEVALQIEMVA
jgi:lysophospholipase L1-like esterase